MQINKKEKYTLVSFNETSFLEFYKAFLNEEKKLRKEHIIIQVFNNINISDKDFLLFLNIAEQKRENGTSFVIISANVDADNFPDNFNIVPTLQEAEDVIDMENMERELGF